MHLVQVQGRSKEQVDMAQEELQPWGTKPDAVDLSGDYLGFTDEE